MRLSWGETAVAATTLAVVTPEAEEEEKASLRGDIAYATALVPA